MALLLSIVSLVCMGGERTAEAGRVVVGSCRDNKSGLFFVKAEQEKKGVRKNVAGF